MIRKIVLFDVPIFCGLKNDQLIAVHKSEENSDQAETKSFPIEDIGVLLCSHPQTTFSQALLARCAELGTMVTICHPRNKMPVALLQPFEGHYLQHKILMAQIQATKPLVKSLWKQVVISKIHNQARALALLSPNSKLDARLMKAAEKVQSGDSTNREGYAASIYWGSFFSDYPEFVRDTEGFPPNNLLNYGYAILRSAMARAVVTAGLQPSIGIFHDNQYNSFCLVDDLMEPYRPYVDVAVHSIVSNSESSLDIDTENKKTLIKTLFTNVEIKGQVSPLQNALQYTANSFVACLLKDKRNLDLPHLTAHSFKDNDDE